MERVVQIDLNRCEDEEDTSYVSWVAEWGLAGNSTGSADSGDDLELLVETVLSDSLRWRESGRHTVRLQWNVGGDEPKGQTIAEAIAAAGVFLPAVANP